MENFEPVLGDGFAHDGKVDIPFLEHRSRLGFFLGMKHHEHALLAFTQHHLIGGHRGLALGHIVKLKPNTQPAFVAHFHRRTDQARGAHILDRDDRAGLHRLRAGLYQPLFGERVAHLNSWALFFDCVVELGEAMVAPPTPSRPVLAPKLTTGMPTPEAVE